MNKVKYSTKQRRTLLDFLASHPDEAFSASQIADSLADEGISKSAVYRNLASLEEEAAVQRESRQGSREALFRYVDTECCRHSLHMNCKSCGKTYHMDDETAAALVRRLAESDSFSVDVGDTVIRGICEKCRH